MGRKLQQLDQIRAEVNCPRCSKLMTILFSTCPLSITDGETGVYQALNLCPYCRTAFFFRPFKLVPLQGSFIEIGRVKRRETERGVAKDDNGNGRVGARIWEKLRSYSRDRAESRITTPRSANGVEVQAPVGPTVEVKQGVSGSNGGGGCSDRGNGWGEANLGKKSANTKSDM